MKIVNFVHDVNNNRIEFDVKVNGFLNHMTVNETEYGCRKTDIGEFTENWSDDAYDALDDFVEGVSSLVLCQGRGIDLFE